MKNTAYSCSLNDVSTLKKRTLIQKESKVSMTIEEKEIENKAYNLLSWQVPLNILEDTSYSPLERCNRLIEVPQNGFTSFTCSARKGLKILLYEIIYICK